MSEDTANGMLLDTVPQQTLEATNQALLLERSDVLLALNPITPVAQAEARAITFMLATGSITPSRVLQLVQGLTTWGEGFPITQANAAIVNPHIRMQHEIWDNLCLMVQHGELPRPPISLTDGMEDRDQQRAIAPGWLAAQAEALQAIHELHIMPAHAILAQLPPFVANSLARDQFGSPYLLGYALYQQQTRPDGTRQSVDHGALSALASTLAIGVITTYGELDRSDSNQLKTPQDTLATCLAWQMALLRSFVVAALDDPDMRLQYALADNLIVPAQLTLALDTVVDTNASSVSWEGSSANQLNLEIRQRAQQDLAAALTDSMRRATNSPLHVVPR